MCDLTPQAPNVSTASPRLVLRVAQCANRVLADNDDTDLNLEYPNLRQYEPDPKSVKRPSNPVALFDIGLTQTFNEGQSSSEDGVGFANIMPVDEEGEIDPAENMHMAMHATANHINRRNWERYCRFAKFDPTVQDPCAEFVLRRFWSRERNADGKYAVTPLAPQWFASTHLVKNIMRGAPVQIMALDMGLGKTIVALLTALCCWEMQHRYQTNLHPTLPWHHPENTTQPADSYSPDFDVNWGSLEDLVESRGIKRPVVRHGPTLFYVPVNIITQWVREFIRCIATTRIKLVVSQRVDSKTRRTEAELYDQVLWPKSLVRGADLPTAADLRKWLPSERAEQIINDGHATVQELLDCGDDGATLALWAKDYWVIAGKGVKALANTSRPDGIRAMWSTVFIDEFHEHVTPKTYEWGVVAEHFPGSQAMVLMSATPYTTPYNLVTRWQSIFASWYTNPNVTRETNNPGLLEMSADEFLFHNKVQLVVDPYLTGERLTSFVRWQFPGQQFPEAMKLINRFVIKGIENHERMRLREAFKTFAEWISPKIIYWTKDLPWDPTESGRPLSAIPIPPHTTWTVANVATDEYNDACNRRWANVSGHAIRVAQGTTQINKNIFFAACHAMQTPLLFNNLPLRMEQDSVLEEEMGGMTVDDAVGLQRKVETHGPDSLRIWRYMSDIHDLPAVTAIRRIVHELQQQTHQRYQMGRKVVITAFKPFSLFLLSLYFRWLAVHGHVQGNEYRTHDFDREIARVTTWEPSHAQRNKAALSQFTKGNRDIGRAEPRPFIMIAAHSQIRAGLELTPADAIISLDSSWRPAETTQVLGRVQRNEKSQLAPHTHAWIVVSESSECNFPRRMTTKGDSAAMMMEDLRKRLEQAQ